MLFFGHLAVICHTENRCTVFAEAAFLCYHRNKHHSFPKIKCFSLELVPMSHPVPTCVYSVKMILYRSRTDHKTVFSYFVSSCFCEHCSTFVLTDTLTNSWIVLLLKPLVEAVLFFFKVRNQDENQLRKINSSQFQWNACRQLSLSRSLWLRI